MKGKRERGGYSLSPTNVPAATIANPIHSPYTTPHSRAMTSCPKRGGKDMTIRMAMGISQPAGRSRTFSLKGRSFCMEREGLGCCLLARGGGGKTYSDDGIVLYGYDDG